MQLAGSTTTENTPSSGDSPVTDGSPISIENEIPMEDPEVVDAGVRSEEIVEEAGVPVELTEREEEQVTAELRSQLEIRTFVRKTVRNLKLPKGKWNTTRLLAMDEFGRFMKPKRMAQWNMVESLDGLAALDAAMAVCQEVMGRKDDGVPTKYPIPELRLNAARCMGELVEEKLKLQEHVQRLSEKANEINLKNARRPVPPAFQLNTENVNLMVNSPASSGRVLPPPAS